VTDRWLLDRAMSMLAALLEERDRISRRLVTLPPEGASLHEIERAALVAALDRTGWVQANAAKILGMTPRVFHYKMARFNLYADDPHGHTAKRTKRSPTNPFGKAHKPCPRKAGKDWRLRAADIH
jgi:hypothetical protein